MHRSNIHKYKSSEVCVQSCTYIYITVLRGLPSLYCWPRQLHSLLPRHHPRLDGWHQHTAQKDLNRVVDKQGHGYQREVLVACKHDLQHWNSQCEGFVCRTENDSHSVCWCETRIIPC